MDLEKIEQGVRMILEGIGEDPHRDGLVETPARVARMYQEVFAGMEQDPAEHFRKTFDEHHQEMVLVRDIPFYSMCEHHLVPFFGKAHVAYIPAADGRVCGLSKLARLVDVFAKRPQVQERLTTQIADTLVEQLKPQGAIVVLEAEHLCMRHQEARFQDGHQRGARRVPEKPEDARGGAVADLPLISRWTRAAGTSPAPPVPRPPRAGGVEVWRTGRSPVRRARPV